MSDHLWLTGTASDGQPLSAAVRVKVLPSTGKLRPIGYVTNFFSAGVSPLYRLFTPSSTSLTTGSPIAVEPRSQTGQTGVSWLAASKRRRTLH